MKKIVPMMSLFLFLIISARVFAEEAADTVPDGHFKIPHLWPGQNPPPEVSSYPLATEQNKSIDFGLKDPYFFPFSSRAFLFEYRQPDGSLLETVASAFKLE